MGNIGKVIARQCRAGFFLVQSVVCTCIVRFTVVVVVVARLINWIYVRQNGDGRRLTNPPISSSLIGCQCT